MYAKRGFSIWCAWLGNNHRWPGLRRLQAVQACIHLQTWSSAQPWALLPRQACTLVSKRACISHATQKEKCGLVHTPCTGSSFLHLCHLPLLHWAMLLHWTFLATSSQNLDKNNLHAFVRQIRSLVASHRNVSASLIYCCSIEGCLGIC